MIIIKIMIMVIMMAILIIMAIVTIPKIPVIMTIINIMTILIIIVLTCRLPRYQALMTFLGSSIGVGKVSDGPLASPRGSFPVLK